MKLQKEIVKELAAYTRLVNRMQKDNRLLLIHLSLFGGLFVGSGTDLQARLM